MIATHPGALSWQPRSRLSMRLFVRSWVAVTGAASLAATVAVHAQAPAAERFAAVPYPRIAMMWANIRGERSFTALAKHDLIMTSVRTFGFRWNGTPVGTADAFTPESVEAGKKRLAELRQINPRAVILGDILFYEYHDDWLPENHAWWLRRDGKRQQFWPGTHRMNWHDADYRRHIVRQTVAVKEAGFDGVFYDNLRLEKEPWLELLKEVRATTGDGFLVLANCGYDVGNYDWVAPLLNGIMYESGWSHKRTQWDDCITKMRHTQSLLRKPRISVIERFEEIRDRAGWPDDPLKAQARKLDPAARRWSLCYSLIVGDFYYLFSDSTSHQHDWHPEYDAKIGQPASEGERVSSHVWKRAYEKALVIVNLPGAETPHMFMLEQPLTDLLTGETKREFSIPPGDGRIFRIGPASTK